MTVNNAKIAVYDRSMRLSFSSFSLSIRFDSFSIIFLADSAVPAERAMLLQKPICAESSYCDASRYLRSASAFALIAEMSWSLHARISSIAFSLDLLSIPLMISKASSGLKDLHVLSALSSFPEKSSIKKEYMRQQESANENISTCCQNGAIFIYADMLSVYMEAV